MNAFPGHASDVAPGHAQPPLPGPSLRARQPVSTAISAQRRDRMAGALLGVHVGDALGSGVEFEPPAVIRERFPHGVRELTGGGPFGWRIGQSTEDVDLTRAVLLAYLDAQNDPSLDVVARAGRHMLTWYEGPWPGRTQRHPVDVGVAIRTSLLRLRSMGEPRSSGAGAGHADSGSLVRSVPIALARPKGTQRSLEAMRISAITHNDPRCTLSCAAYVDMIGALVAGATVPHAVKTAEATVLAMSLDRAAPGEVLAAISSARHLPLREIASDDVASARLVDQGSGYVLNALKIAVAALCDERPFAETIADVIAIGGDTDTNAAIAGGLLGARDGLSAIPAQWLAPLEFRDEFLAAVQTLEFGDLS